MSQLEKITLVTIANDEVPTLKIHLTHLIEVKARATNLTAMAAIALAAKAPNLLQWATQQANTRRQAAEELGWDEVGPVKVPAWLTKTYLKSVAHYLKGKSLVVAQSTFTPEAVTVTNTYGEFEAEEQEPIPYWHLVAEDVLENEDFKPAPLCNL